MIFDDLGGGDAPLGDREDDGDGRDNAAEGVAENPEVAENRVRESEDLADDEGLGRATVGPRKIGRASCRERV